MNTPNATRHQQVILLDHDKAEKLDKLAKYLVVSKQALMREAIDDFLSVHGLHRSARIHGIRQALVQCELLMRKASEGKLSEPDIRVTCTEVLHRLKDVLGRLGDPKVDRTRPQLIPRGKI